MEDYHDEIRDRDDRVRHFEYEGTKWMLQAGDPYGFWQVTSKEGRTPACLCGAYTSFIQGELDITKYVNESLAKVKAKSERIEKAIFKEPRKHNPKD